MKAVFVDTSALLPLMDRDASEHDEVVEAVRDLAGENTPLFTTSYTLVEAGALVRNRLGIEAFRALGSVVLEAVEIVWVDEALHRKAWRKVASAGSKGPSLVDWVSFITMRNMGIEHALTLDRHFVEQGFSKIP